MGWLRKKAKQIGNAFKKVGKVLKKGLGKIGKFFGKLGPLGSLALSFMFSYFGGPILQWLNKIPGVSKITQVFKGIKSFATDIGKSIYGTVTEGIQAGINRIGQAFGKEGMGDGFKTFVDNVTGLGETPAPADVPVVDATPLSDTAVETAADTNFVPTADGVNVPVTDATPLSPMNEAERIKFLKTEEGKNIYGDTEDESFFTLLKNNPDDGMYKNFKKSKEGKAYKKFNIVGKTGSIINQADEQEEYLRQMQEKNEASYFSTQGQALLSSAGVDNFSRSSTGINFLDISSFNPEMDPNNQYLIARGLPTNIDARDAGGYGYDIEAYLKEQVEMYG